MQTHFDVLIVGTGHAGAQAAIALRQQQFAGTVAMVGDEPWLPYERPPLSKDYLSGEKSFERLLIRPPAFWDERQVAMRLGRRVVDVDAAAHRVRLDDGTHLEYGSLVWAAGGTPRRLMCAGANAKGVHVVRTRDDVDGMMRDVAAGARAVVVGGGYIGLEAAAVLVKLGKQVTVLEAADRVLARVAGEPLSRFYEREHRAHGVDLRLCAQVSAIETRDGRVAGVHLGSDEVIPADLVVVGIGITPNVAPLLAAGAFGGNGVAVDGQCRTTLPDVYAIGDCALQENRYFGGQALRLESVQNANDQAVVAAKAVQGGQDVYEAVPWFWSNQYDLKLQTVGLSGGHDQVVLRGDPVERTFTLVYLKAGRVIALDCVNATRDYVQGRALVVEHSAISPERLADTNVPLKEIAREAQHTL